MCNGVMQGLRRHPDRAVREQGGRQEPPSKAQAGHLSQVRVCSHCLVLFFAKTKSDSGHGSVYTLTNT